DGIRDWSVTGVQTCALPIYNPNALTVCSFISAASLVEVWSFHKTNMAFGLFSNAGIKDRGVPNLSTATGVDPVVSTEIAFIDEETALPAIAPLSLIVASR